LPELQRKPVARLRAHHTPIATTVTMTMRIGVPKEIKNHEYRVGITPSAVREALHHGHEVLVQSGAGAGIGCDDTQYVAAGATVLPDAAAVFDAAQMIVKVKEPQPHECAMLRKGQLLFTYLHLAPDPLQADGLQRSGCTAIAYETITGERGGLPLLAPMSEVAGRMSIQVGAVALQQANGGRGVLLGGVPGVAPGRVVVIGGGVVGTHAARMAAGLGADVTVLDRSLPRLRQLDELFGARVRTQYATLDATEAAVLEADLVVGAVLVPGAAAPKLIKRAQLARMRRGAVIVDVAIDQGGCFETSRATTHAEPTYVVDGVVHYCVANMPGAVPRTSTFALNHATLPFTLALADKGWRRACTDDAHLRAGLTVHDGAITHEAVAAALNKPYVPAHSVLQDAA
jgi:alanine dehydrogenase